MSEQTVWVFVGPNATLPSGVFSSLDEAEIWISNNKLSGILTRYPVGLGIYDWALSKNFYKPKSDKVVDSKFIARFTSAYLAHYHYEDGIRNG